MRMFFTPPASVGTQYVNECESEDDEIGDEEVAGTVGVLVYCGCEGYICWDSGSLRVGQFWH